METSEYDEVTGDGLEEETGVEEEEPGEGEGTREAREFTVSRSFEETLLKARESWSETLCAGAW